MVAARIGSLVTCTIISFALYNPTKRALGGHLCVCMCVYAGKTLSGQPFQGRWVRAPLATFSCAWLCSGRKRDSKGILGSGPSTPAPAQLRAALAPAFLPSPNTAAGRAGSAGVPRRADRRGSPAAIGDGELTPCLGRPLPSSMLSSLHGVNPEDASLDTQEGKEAQAYV